MYIINKVLFNNKNDLIEKKITVNTLNVIYNKIDALEYISNLKYLDVFCEEIELSHKIKKEPVSNKDIDGYHLVVDDENTQKFNLYHKQTLLDKGYVYNTVKIDIDFIGFIEIANHDNTFKNKCISNKKRLEDIQETNQDCDDIEIINPNKKIKICNKKNTVLDNHKYVELNDKLIEELKKKLDMLSLKKNI
jgi:hypothetical protein